MDLIAMVTGDLFTEKTTDGYVWEFELFDTDNAVVIARRVMVRFTNGDSYYWRRINSPQNETMNPYADVKNLPCDITC